MFIKQLLTSVAVFAIISAHAQDAEIKQILLNETQSYFKKDFKTWSTFWVPEASTSRTYYGGTTLLNMTGWDSIKAREERSFTRNPKPADVEITNDSFSIRNDGKIAVVYYKQTVKFLKSQPPFDKFTTAEHRVLVKNKGQWKIANQVSTDLGGYGGPNELTLNEIGYSYLFQGKMEEAIKVLELNTKLFPDSYNVFDSLGEAYAKAGKNDLAIQNYEKSLQLNPDSESGKQALKDLKP